MRTVCFRCGEVLGMAGKGPGDSHGVCVSCAREWMAAAGVCPAGAMTRSLALRCWRRCPVAGQCERLARSAVPAYVA